MIEYKNLYDRQIRESEAQSHKIRDLENRQSAIESSFRNIFRLHRDLLSFTKDAEKENDRINREWKRIRSDSTNSVSSSKGSNSISNDQPFNPGASSNRKSLFNQRLASPSLVQAATDQQSERHKELNGFHPPLVYPPLGPPPPCTPQVQYDWEATSLYPSSTTSYSFLTRSNPFSRSRGSTRADELKLKFVFDSITAKDMPDKIELEIKDKEGRTVFKKKQNIYYIKVQERVSILDAEQDYTLEVTTENKEKKKSKKEVTIKNKHAKKAEKTAKPKPEPPMVLKPVIVPEEAKLDEQEVLPSLETVIQDFIEEAKVLEEKNEPIVTVVEEPKPKEDEPKEDEAKEVVIKQASPVREPLNAINPCLLKRKTLIPKVQYRWQKGFRKASTSSSSSYIRVPILKVTLDFDPKNNPEPVLPKQLTLQVIESNLGPKVTRVFQGRARAEFQLPDDQNFTVTVAVDNSMTGLDSVPAGLRFQVQGVSGPGLENWAEAICQEIPQS